MDPQSGASGNNETRKTIIVLVVLAILAVGVVAFVASRKKNTDSSSNSPASQSSDAGSGTTPQSESGNQQTDVATYKDGTYDASGSYNSPGGVERVDVSITLKHDKVADASVISRAKNPTAKQFQAKFLSGYKAQVIGKDVDTLELTHVSGSSLTPNGFNDALDKIRNHARG